MTSFWDRRIAEIRNQPGPPPSHLAPPQAYPPPGPPPGQYGPLPGYVQQQLAIRHGGQKEADLARHIQHEGYIRRPPSWVQRQPRDRCPNCGSPDYAAISSGGYAAPGTPGSIMRCFDCNYSTSRGVPALYGIPASGPVTGAAVQSADGSVNLRNTGLISG